MIKKKLIIIGLTMALSIPGTIVSFADTVLANNTTTMENCGAYLFEWQPVDCGNGHYFAILVGGNSISESDVILKRGYDYAYTFNSMTYPRPWGEVPALVNVDGVWAIPENQPALPEGTQPTLQIVLTTNNKKLPEKERFIDVVRLPGNVSSSSLPPEVRKYLINVDGSDAGAYSGTNISGWETGADGRYRYRKPDGTYVVNGWLNVDDELYYMDEEGYMMADAITPDGAYVNVSGQKQKYMPGWMQNERGWKYVLKNGYYAASTWITDTDGKSYYFDMGGYMKTDYDTPDGYHVGPDGVWDGQPTTQVVDTMKLGPGAQPNTEESSVESDSSNLTAN
ncbi:MAG: choline-binding protein [Enterocloster sp.]